MRCGVVMPVRGFAPYLAEAVESVLAERPDAVVLVDDASPEPLRLHPDHAPHVTLLRLERSGGPGNARAEGERALPRDVEAVATCDADDAWAPGSLAPRLAALERAGWSFGRAYVVGPDGRPTGERWTPLEAGLHEGAALGRRLYLDNPIPVSSAVVRRDWLARAGGFARDLAAAEDWDLWLRLCAAGAVAASVPQALVRYRRHPAAMTADVAAMARGQRTVHARHAALVDATTAAAALRADDAALAGGLAREGDLRGVLRAVRRAGRPALRPVLAGLRRRDPYRR